MQVGIASVTLTSEVKTRICGKSSVACLRSHFGSSDSSSSHVQASSALTYPTYRTEENIGCYLKLLLVPRLRGPPGLTRKMRKARQLSQVMERDTIVDIATDARVAQRKHEFIAEFYYKRYLLLYIPSLVCTSMTLIVTAFEGNARVITAVLSGVGTLCLSLLKVLRYEGRQQEHLQAAKQLGHFIIQYEQVVQRYPPNPDTHERDEAGEQIVSEGLSLLVETKKVLPSTDNFGFPRELIRQWRDEIMSDSALV